MHLEDKEWWYSGVFDHAANIYFSFFFIRTAITDHFSFTLFDPEQEYPIHFAKNIILNATKGIDKLCLRFASKNMNVEYLGDAETGWNFKFKNNKYDIDLNMESTTCGFTKFDNYFVNKYALLHYFHNIVNGTIQMPDKIYQVDKALGYYDHCFGRVPRKSAWHWLAVQNAEVALDSLINYGPFAQKYTQAYFKECSRSPRANEWIRLNQEVSFEYYPDKFNSYWKVTSVDLDLIVTPLMHICSLNKIPPIVPFLINITHYEFFVKVSGKVRIDCRWMEVKNLYGVLEEHFGKW